jgi:hypothetical protein
MDDNAVFYLFLIWTAIIAIFFGVLGRNLEVDYLCTENGYDGREFVNGVAYCRLDTNDGQELFALNDLIADAE